MVCSRRASASITTIYGLLSSISGTIWAQAHLDIAYNSLVVLVYVQRHLNSKLLLEMLADVANLITLLPKLTQVSGEIVPNQEVESRADDRASDNPEQKLFDFLVRLLLALGRRDEREPDGRQLWARLTRPPGRRDGRRGILHRHGFRDIRPVLQRVQ